MTDTIESMDELVEAGMAKVLDSDDFGALYQVNVPEQTISVYASDDGDILTTSDWQEIQPQTCADMAEYEWVPVDMLAELQ